MSKPEPPGAHGIDAGFKKLQKHVDTLFANLGRQLADGFARLERIEQAMGSQLDQMNEKLASIAASETVLGQSIQQVVDFLKSNPSPTDLTQQLGALDRIAQELVDRNASVLANLPPTPEPPPITRRR